jgi:hypothetical protein
MAGLLMVPALNSNQFPADQIIGAIGLRGHLDETQLNDTL